MSDAPRMTYAGQVCERLLLTAPGVEPIEVPYLPHGVPGHAIGDFAVIDHEAVEWNGREWAPSAWRNLDRYTRRWT